LPPSRSRLAQIRTAILVNWPAKLTALLLSGVLWAAVAAEEPTTQLVPVNLEVDPPSGRRLAGELPPVQAVYVGSTRELIKLYSSPPVIRKVLPDTLTGSEYQLELSPQDLIAGRRINVRPEDVQPRAVTIRLDAVVQRSVAVEPRVTIVPDSDFAVVGGIGVSPPTVVVSGPDSAVRALSTIPTVRLELRSVSSPVRRTLAIDTTGMGAVRVSPESVQVSADVTFVAERVLPGVPVTVRSDRPGLTADPGVVLVTIRGASRRLASLTRDSLVVIASPVTGDSTERVILEVITPDGVTGIAMPDSVTLTRRPRG
jgi:hypothetical protein